MWVSNGTPRAPVSHGSYALEPPPLLRESGRSSPLLQASNAVTLSPCVPCQIPNFWSKFYAGTGALYAVGLGVPLFAVWWQQSKLKA